MRSALVIAGLMAVVSLGSVWADRDPTAGSFMATPVRSTGQFIERLKKDTVLQKRYGKHLGLAWEAVPRYVGERLRADRIRKDAFFTIYNVTGNGQIYPTKQRLSAGTRIYRLGNSEVFFTTQGDPARPFFTPVAQRPVVQRAVPDPVETVLEISVPSE